MKKITLLLVAMIGMVSIAFAQPPNDVCATAIDLQTNVIDLSMGCDGGTANNAVLITGATDSGVPQVCSSPGNDIWYVWTATATSLLVNDGTGSPGFAVFASCADATAGNEIDCTNTFAGTNSILTGWTIGQTIYIQVYDFAGSSSDIGFCIIDVNAGCTDPAAQNYDPAATLDDGSCYYEVNDVCDGALPWPAAISPTSCTDGSGTVNLDFTLYGNPFGDTNGCDGLSGDAIAWYTYTVPIIGSAGDPYYDLIWDDGDGFPNNCGIGVEFYEGTACGSLTSIACINNLAGTVSGLIQGTTYYIIVWDDGSGGANCDFCLSQSTACVGPAVNSTATCVFGEDNIYIEVDVTAMGLGNPSGFTVDVGGPQANITAVGTYTYGPFAPGSSIDVTLTGIDDGTCGYTAMGLSIDCTCDPAAVDAGMDATICAGETATLTATRGFVGLPTTPMPYTRNDACGTAFIDISGTGTALGLIDDGEIGINTANSYNFYGTEYNVFTVGNNGDFYCGDPSEISDNGNETIDGSGSGSNAGTPAIFPAWDDWDSETGDVYWEEQGNVLIVQWDDRPHFSGFGAIPGDGVTFQMQFDASTGVITFIYTDLDEGESEGNTIYDDLQSASIGIDNADGMNFDEFSFNTAQPGLTCVSYTPPMIQCDFVAWVTDPNDVAGTTVGTTETIMVSPTMTTTYYAVVQCNNLCADDATVTVDCNSSCIVPPIISITEDCIDGTVGQCSYSLVPSDPSHIVVPQDMAATQNEMDGFQSTPFDIDVTDQFGCTQTYSVIKPACNCNANFEPDFVAADPCSCNNDQSANGAGDGTFSETVSVVGTCGFTLFADAGASPASIAGAMFTAGPPDPASGLCTYTLTFNHVDGVGYDLCVVDAFGNPINSATTGLQICFSNVCEYPVITEPALGPYCSSDGAVTPLDGLVSEVSGNPGTVSVTVNGNATNSFDPGALGAGSHTVEWTFSGSFVDDNGGTVIDPAYPGCETTFATIVDVEDGPPVAVCNADVTIFAAANGCATVDPTVLDGGSFDPTACDVASLSVDITEICCSDGNPTLVTLTVTNTAGNTDSCESSVTLDNRSVAPPTARCADITVNLTAFGCVPVTPGMVDNGSSAICGSVILSSVSPDEFCCEVLGSNSYTLNVTDPVTGFTDDCSGTVTVEDNQAPEFLCPSDKTIQLEPGLCGDLSRQGLPMAIDNCGDLVIEKVSGPEDNVDFLTIGGPYSYSFLVTDIGGNTATCEYDVFIIPYQNPTDVLTCNDHVYITANLDCEVDFTADMMLEGGPYTCYEFYNVSVENTVDPNTFEVTVTDPETGIACWGLVTVEDKNDPEIDCEICPPVNGTSAADYDPDCVLNCYEQPILQLRYDDGLRDDLVQEDYEDFVEDAVTDNCDNYNEDDVSFYDQWTSLGACVGTRLTRTWTVGFERADGSRGTVSCTREYFFRPLDFSRVTGYALDPLGNPIFEAKEDSLVVPPETIELPCGVDLSPAGIAAFFDDPTTVDRDTDDNNIDPDELDVDLVVENNEGIRWAYPHYYQDGVGSGGPHAQAINNEACNIIVGYTDSEIDACAVGCDGNRKVLRNWTVLDWCVGEFITYGQIIKSIDQNPPFLTVPDVTASVDPWECAATVNLPHPEHIGDDCDANVTYYIGNRNGFNLSGDAENGFVLTGVPLGSYEIEYLAEDCCGNVGRTTMTITVVDNTPPVAVSKEFIVLSLTNIGNQVDEFQGVAKLYAEDVDNGSYDGCTDVTFEVRRTPVCDPDDAEWGPFVTFCCEDLNGGTDANIDVELKITDEYGNENIVWATVLLEDKSATIPVIPPHMFLTCDMDYNNLDMTGGIPRFFGACGEAEIDCDTLEVYESTEPRELRASDGVIIDGIGPIEAPAYDPSCGFGAIRRQFRGCGDGIQWFVILPVDPFDPTTIVWPDDVVVDCDDYEVGEPSWEEATCNLVGISMEADTFYFEDGACYKILNHWSVINWCIYDPSNPSAGGRYEHVQEVKIIDTVDPVLTVADSLCFAVDGNCLSSNVSLSGSAVDDGDCASDWISWDVSIDAYSDWSEDFHYATTNPRLLPNGEPNPYHIPKTGNGVDATITLPDGIPSSKIWHRAVWRAYDGCGNTSSVTTYFQIVDKKAPTPYCLNLSTAVMSNGQVELWAIDFNVGSFDNCTDSENLLFTFTDVPPPPRDDTEYDSNDDLMWYNGTFWYYNSEDIDPDTGAGEYEGQDDYGGEVHRWEPGLRSAGKVFTAADADASGFAQVPIYVWDECGNIDFCMVNLRIVDNGGGGMAMVSGKVATEFGAEVEQVVTEMEGSLNFRDTDVTDAQGEYAFANTPFYADYQVSGEKNDDYLNGVSTLDLIMIQRHIIGIEALDSPYKMIAADVNNDNSISAVDLIELRKLILGIYDELPENGSWKFVNADNTLDVNDPFSYSETRAIEDLASDMMAEDFIGVKIGDVNESVVANARTQSTEVSNKASVVKMSYEDKQVEEGDIVEINLSTDRADVYGYQFTLNTAGMELVDVQGMDADHVAVFENRLTVSHNSLTAKDQNDEVTLVMRAKTDASVSELMTIGSELTRAEAYVGEDLEVVSIDLRDSREDAVFALYQNEPNPFADYTLIGFELPQAGQATITMYDVTGKVLNVIQGQYERGYNTVKVTKEDIGVSGMIYYRLESGSYSAAKHMITIN